MTHLVRERTLAYLENHNVMTLSTLGPEGLWGAAVFYVNHGFSLYFLSAPTSRHSMNIVDHPRIAATIQEDYHNWRDIRGIQLEGEACIIEGAEQEMAIKHYQKKFPITGPKAPPEIALALDKIRWYKVVPDRLYFIDNSLGLGHRDAVL